MFTSPAFLLRILFGFGFVAAPIAAGVLGRSPWIIPLFGAAFAVSFVLGKRSNQGRRAPWSFWTSALMGFPVTLLVQILLVGVLYLAGLGGSMLFGRADHAPGLANSDWLAAAGLLGLGVCSLFIPRLDFATAAEEAASPQDDDAADSGRVLNVSAAAVTPETFFEGIHYSHGTTDADGRYDGTPNEKSEGSDRKILEAEQRLGVVLPDGLKALYRIQNGGSVGQLVVAKVAEPRPHYSDWIWPFIGYGDLHPLENLRTVCDLVCDYADPDLDSDAAEFPIGSRNMIALAQWYRCILFLDYRGRTIPRVGFTDLDRDDYEATTIWFDTFDDFFSSLRRVAD